MKKELFDKLYNRDAKIVTAEDVYYYNKILEHNNNEKAMKHSMLGAFFGTLPIMALVLYIMFMGNPLKILTFFAFGVIIDTVIVGGAALLFNKFYTAPEGLTKEEYKALKKSGGVKRIRELVKEYQLNSGRCLAEIELEQQQVKIKEELRTIEKQRKDLDDEKMALIRQMIKNNEAMESIKKIKESQKNATQLGNYNFSDLGSDL